MSKFKPETSFLYQLFKGNSNFIVLKPCTLIFLSIFYDFHCYLYLFICFFMHLYTFISTFYKTFLVSKFNSETSFLYQLFKENSNFIVKQPCKVIYLSIFYYSFITYEYMYVCMYIHTYICMYVCVYVSIHVCMYICMYV